MVMISTLRVNRFSTPAITLCKYKQWILQQGYKFVLYKKTRTALKIHNMKSHLPCGLSQSKSVDSLIFASRLLRESP